MYSKNNRQTVSYIPSQMDIVITENCNQTCDYCFVSKHIRRPLSYYLIKKGVDCFFHLPIKEQTITFTTTEPLFYVELYSRVINYIQSKAISKNKCLNIITTTNAVNINKKIGDFLIRKINGDPKFKLNVSMDGKKSSYDAHRRPATNKSGSSFLRVWDHLTYLPRRKVRAIFTITPSETNKLSENLSFLLESDFRKIDIFPQMYILWPKEKLKTIEKSLTSFIEHVNKAYSYDFDLSILNRLCGNSRYSKLLLGNDGNFYLFEPIISLPYKARKNFIIGNVTDGIDLEKRNLLFGCLFKNIDTTVLKLCFKCKYSNLCSFPLSLFIWCKHYKKNFNIYYQNYCSISKIFIYLFQQINQPLRNTIESNRLKNLLRDE